MRTVLIFTSSSKYCSRPTPLHEAKLNFIGPTVFLVSYPFSTCFNIPAFRVYYVPGSVDRNAVKVSAFNEFTFQWEEKNTKNKTVR